MTLRADHVVVPWCWDQDDLELHVGR